MKNKLAYLGFLGFFGFLGIFSFLGENIDMLFGFLGFFSFFFYAKITPDEFFILHVKNAATRAFFTGVVIGVIMLCGTVMVDSIVYLRLLIVLNFVIPLLVFAISLELFEQREKKVIRTNEY